MGIHEAGNDRASRKRNSLGVRKTIWAETGNGFALYGEESVAYGRYGDGTNPVGFKDGHAEKTWDRTVNFSIRSGLTKRPGPPGSERWEICPAEETTTGGSMM